MSNELSEVLDDDEVDSVLAACETVQPLTQLSPRELAKAIMQVMAKAEGRCRQGQLGKLASFYRAVADELDVIEISNDMRMR